MIERNTTVSSGAEHYAERHCAPLGDVNVMSLMPAETKGKAAKIPVVGYYGYNNVGDEAFRSVFTQYANGQILDFKRLVGKVQAKDLIVGGGAVINEFFLKAIPASSSLHFIGVSLPNGPNDLVNLSRLKSQIRQLIFRSREDMSVAADAGYNAMYAPDLVFALDDDRRVAAEEVVAKAALQPIGFKSQTKKLFVFLSDDYSIDSHEVNTRLYTRNDQFMNVIANTLDTLSEKFDIIMPSMSIWYSARDYVFSGQVVRRMKRRERVCIIEKYLEPEEILAAVSGCDSIVLSMKFHGLVFGIKSKKLTINIGSTRKNIHLMKDAGLEGLSAPIGQVTSDILLGLVQKHRDERLLSKIGQVADDHSEAAREALKSAFLEIIKGR